jgi:hypothetical protein
MQDILCVLLLLRREAGVAEYYMVQGVLRKRDSRKSGCHSEWQLQLQGTLAGRLARGAGKKNNQ